MESNTLLPLWLTPDDFTQRYGFSKQAQAIVRMRKNQLKEKIPLPFSKIGKKIFYNAKLIDEWIMNNQQDMKGA
ncbi:MAG: hypothetical protein SPF98_05395 [Campylobacter sp.]|nr:hypothetical protein [Campylobacter sp.]